MPVERDIRAVDDDCVTSRSYPEYEENPGLHMRQRS